MSLDQMREYLARVLPWPQDETNSFGNIHWTFVPKDLEPGRKLPWTGRACRNVDDAAKAIAWAQKNDDTRDIYACMSSQLTSQEVTTAKGWKYHKPVRLAENAVAVKGLWLDIDIKDPAKGYPTLNDAITALGNFLKASGMPKPSMIVGSGGGLHVYWLVNRALTTAEWYPLAAALVEATNQHDLKCDNVTTDAARVLRVPGTLNHKTTPPRPVKILARTDFDYLFEKLDKILTPYKIAGALPSHLAGFAPGMPRLAPIKGDSDLGGGIETAMPQAEIRACLDAIPNPGTDWNAWNTVGMRVFAACEGADYGLVEWQRWSDQATTAGADSCEARWETLQSSPPTRTGAGALVNAARTATGDPAWNVRKSLAPGVPNAVASIGGLSKNTSASAPSSTAPAAIGTGLGLAPASVSTLPASNSPVADPHLPHGYSRDAMGLIWLIGLDDDGKTTRTPISDYPMTDPWLQKDPRLLHFQTRVDRGRVQMVDLPLELVGTNEMRKHLQCQGLMLRAQPKLATEFFLSWIKKLQESKDTVNSSPFGWNVVNGKQEGFVYGGKEFSATGTRPAASGDMVLLRQYSPTGDMQKWIDAAKMITSQGRPALEAVVASSFAAPLVMFTGHRGTLMSVWSQESGVGKTTALNTAQAVWGSPVKAVQMLDDTGNSVMDKIGEIRSLPVYWDELKTEEDTKKFVNIVFKMTGGKGKSRLTQGAKQREVGDWKTLLMVASNNSLLDYIVTRTSTTPAGLVRLFEVEVTKAPAGSKGQIDSTVAQRMTAELDYNYGQVGLMYAEFLGTNIDRINKEIGDHQAKLNAEVEGTQEERFWIALIGMLLMGAKYANELGVIKFDIPVLKKFLIERLQDMRRERLEQPVDMKIAMNVSNVLAQFLNAMKQRHTILTNRIHIRAGKPVVGSIKILNGENMARIDGLYVQIGVEDKLLRISSTYLSEWLEGKGYSRPIFTKALTNEFDMKKVHGCMASGTSQSGATEYLLEIDLAGRASTLIDGIIGK